MNFNLEGEFEPERHLVPHEADGRDEQAGPAGPFLFKKLSFKIVMTIIDKYKLNDKDNLKDGRDE